MKLDKKLFRDLEQELQELNLKITSLKNTLTGLRSVCDHEWECDGHDSHHDWEKCSICGETRSI